MLSNYLAGKCLLSDAREIKKHLAGCPGCTADLEEMRQLDRVLDLWDPEPAPGDFWHTVLAEVAKDGFPYNNPPKTGKDGKLFGLPAWGRMPGFILRDLVAAAAVTVLIFWNAGALLEGGKMTAAGKNVNGAVAAYTRVTDIVLEQAAETAGKFTRKIIFEEWKQK